MKNNALSVVVPCYNSADTIADCIEAIKNSADTLSPSIAYQIIIVDDGSTDNSMGSLKETNNIKIVTHSSNCGLASARNAGINASQSEYIAFIDSDIIIEQDWFQKMLTLLNNDSSVVGVTGHLMPPLSKKTCSVLDLYLFSKYRGAKNLDNTIPLLYKWFVFSNTIVRRRIINKVGGFDENFTHYGGEDTELAIRINKKFPLDLRKCREASGYHHSGKTLNQYLDNMFEYGLNNLYLIIQKHPDYKKALGYNMINYFRGYLIFNPISRIACFLILKWIKHPLLIKFLVISSFVRGARTAAKK